MTPSSDARIAIEDAAEELGVAIEWGGRGSDPLPGAPAGVAAHQLRTAIEQVEEE